MTVVTDSMYDFEPVICPVCEHENSHIVGTRLNDENYYSRNGNVVIVITGECGHNWQYIIREHKGSVFLDIAIETKDYNKLKGE